MNSPSLPPEPRTTSPQRRSGWYRHLRPSRQWLILPPIAVGVLMMVIMVRSRQEIPRSEVPEQKVPVAVLTAKLETVEIKVTGFGTAEAARSWTAVAEVGGRIEAIHPSLDSGNWVSAGETLVRIDVADYELRLAQRTADLNAARASLAERKASQVADNKSLQIEKDLLRVARKDFERLGRFRDSNAVSLSEMELAESNLLKQTQAVQQLENALSLYPSRIASAQAMVAMAEAAVGEAQRNLDRTIITSPLRGVLAGVNLEAGQVVSQGQQLFQIQDNSRVEIMAQISLAQLQQLIPADSFSAWRRSVASSWLSDLRAEAINSSGGETFRWSGKPIRLTESVDAQTRTIGVVVAVDNALQARNDIALADPGHSGRLAESAGAGDVLPITLLAVPPNPASDNGSALPPPPSESTLPPRDVRMPLQPGTYCEVRLIGAPRSQVIALPRTAFEGDCVYVVDQQHRLRKRLVHRGAAIDDRVIVQSGIEAGEQVVVQPPVPAIEGMLVRPR